MNAVVSIMLAILFFMLAALHVYWSLGGNWGKDVVIPVKQNQQKIMSPGALSTLIVATCFLLFGFFILIKGRLINIIVPAIFIESGTWIIALVFLARAFGKFKYVGFFKEVKHTKFGKYDTNFYSPLSVAIALLLMLSEFHL